DGYSFQPVEEALVVAEDPASTPMEFSIKQEIDVMLACLTPRERKIIELRYDLTHEYGEMRTLDEIGKLMHITRERVRQIEDRAFKKIKYKLHIVEEKNLPTKTLPQKADENTSRKPAPRYSSKTRKTPGSAVSSKIDDAKTKESVIEIEGHTL